MAAAISSLKTARPRARLEIGDGGGGDADGLPVRRAAGRHAARRPPAWHRGCPAGRRGRHRRRRTLQVGRGQLRQAQQPRRPGEQAGQRHRAPLPRRGDAVEHIAEARIVQRRHRPALAVRHPGLQLRAGAVEHGIVPTLPHAVEAAYPLRPAGREEQRPGVAAAPAHAPGRCRRPHSPAPAPARDPRAASGSGSARPRAAHAPRRNRAAPRQGSRSGGNRPRRWRGSSGSGRGIARWRASARPEAIPKSG